MQVPRQEALHRGAPHRQSWRLQHITCTSFAFKGLGLQQLPYLQVGQVLRCSSSQGLRQLGWKACLQGIACTSDPSRSSSLWRRQHSSPFLFSLVQLGERNVRRLLRLQRAGAQQHAASGNGAPRPAVRAMGPKQMVPFHSLHVPPCPSHPTILTCRLHSAPLLHPAPAAAQQ